MRVQMPRRDLRVARLDSLEQRVVDEDVLVLCLHHVIALRTQTRYVTVDVDRSLVFHAFQHRVDHDKRARSTYSRALHTHTHARENK